MNHSAKGSLMFRWNDPDFVIIFESKTLFLQSHRPLLLHWQINENTARGAALFGRFLIFSTVSLGLKLSFSFLLFFFFFFTCSNILSWLFHISIFTRFLLSTYGTPQLSIALTARTQWYFAVRSWMSLCSRVMRLSLILSFDSFAACRNQCRDDCRWAGLRTRGAFGGWQGEASERQCAPAVGHVYDKSIPDASFFVFQWNIVKGEIWKKKKNIPVFVWSQCQWSNLR